MKFQEFKWVLALERKLSSHPRRRLILGAAALAINACNAEGEGKRGRIRVVVEKRLKPEGSPSSAAWSPDGSLIATSDTLDTRVAVWQVGSGKRLYSILKHNIGSRCLQFIESGRYLLTSAVTSPQDLNWKSMSLVDVATGEVIQDIVGPIRDAAALSVNIAQQVVLSPSRPLAVTVTHHDSFSYLSFYETDTWRITEIRKCTYAYVSDLAFSPADGNLIVAYVNDRLDVWDVEAKLPIDSFKGNARLIGSKIAISPDGEKLAASRVNQSGITIWDTTAWSQITNQSPVPQGDLRVRSISWSGDGQFIASLNYDGHVRLWDAANLSILGPRLI